MVNPQRVSCSCDPILNTISVQHLLMHFRSWMQQLTVDPIPSKSVQLIWKPTCTSVHGTFIRCLFIYLEHRPSKGLKRAWHVIKYDRCFAECRRENKLFTVHVDTNTRSKRHLEPYKYVPTCKYIASSRTKNVNGLWAWIKLQRARFYSFCMSVGRLRIKILHHPLFPRINKISIQNWLSTQSMY